MDVIVIGCGAAGVSAIRGLHDAGLSVMGLEASDRLGGRCWSLPFGEGLVDFGAGWCIGEKGNKIFEIANTLNLLEGPLGEDTNCIVYNDTADDTGKIIEFLNDAIQKADKNNTKSISECLRGALSANKNLFKDPKVVDAVLEWYERNRHLGGQTDPRTGKSLKGLVESRPCPGKLLNWKGKGFQTLIDVLLNKYPDPSKEIPVQMLLNKDVEKIKWKSEEQGNPVVHVKCKDGSTYSAKNVIVTIPIGVLKERHTQLFDPPLPNEKVNCIDNIHMYLIDKILVEFDKPWWPSTRTNFSIFWLKEDKAKFSSEEQWVTEIYGFQTVEYRPNLLLFWIYGNGAEVMEKKSMEEVKAGVKKLIDTMLTKYSVSNIKNITRTQWSINPYSRGAYTSRSVATEQSGASATTLSNPLTNGDFPVVCFAGEATSRDSYGSAHGAVESGFREAERLIASLRKSK